MSNKGFTEAEEMLLRWRRQQKSSPLRCSPTKDSLNGRRSPIPTSRRNRTYASTSPSKKRSRSGSSTPSRGSSSSSPSTVCSTLASSSSESEEEIPDAPSVDWRGLPTVQSPPKSRGKHKKSTKTSKKRKKTTKKKRKKKLKKAKKEFKEKRSVSRERDVSRDRSPSRSSVDSLGRELRPGDLPRRRKERSQSRSWSRSRSPSRSVSPATLARQPPPPDPLRPEHDRFRSRGRGRGSDRDPVDWGHDKFIEELKEPSPERVIPDNYVPPQPEWFSRAGGVYIPNRRTTGEQPSISGTAKPQSQSSEMAAGRYFTWVTEDN